MQKCLLATAAANLVFALKTEKMLSSLLAPVQSSNNQDLPIGARGFHTSDHMHILSPVRRSLSESVCVCIGGRSAWADRRLPWRRHRLLRHGINGDIERPLLEQQSTASNTAQIYRYELTTRLSSGGQTFRQSQTAAAAAPGSGMRSDGCSRRRLQCQRPFPSPSSESRCAQSAFGAIAAAAAGSGALAAEQRTTPSLAGANNTESKPPIAGV